jgi:hypothetical protein
VERYPQGDRREADGTKYLFGTAFWGREVHNGYFGVFGDDRGGDERTAEDGSYGGGGSRGPGEGRIMMTGKD